MSELRNSKGALTGGGEEGSSRVDMTPRRLKSLRKIVRRVAKRDAMERPVGQWTRYLCHRARIELIAYTLGTDVA